MELKIIKLKYVCCVAFIMKLGEFLSVKKGRTEVKMEDLNICAAYIFKQAGTLFTLNYESLNSEL